MVGRLTLALSPHRRLRDRPTTPMRSGPTAETCLRRTCRFPFFCRYILRPRLPSTNRDSGRGKYGTCLSPFSYLYSSGGPNPRWARAACSMGFFTCIISHHTRESWLVCLPGPRILWGQIPDMPSPRSPGRRRGLARRVSCSWVRPTPNHACLDLSRISS